MNNLVTPIAIAINLGLLIYNIHTMWVNQQAIEALKQANIILAQANATVKENLKESDILKHDYIRLFCALAGPDASDIEAHEGGHVYHFACPKKGDTL